MSGKFLTVEELEQVFEEIGDDLFRYLKALCRNPDDASDLLQTVFVKFIEQVKKGRILKETSHHYLRRMARNEFTEFMRRRREVATLDVEGRVASEGDAVGETVEREETARQIRLILMESLADPGLPGDVAEILRLRLEEGVELADICDRVNKSRSTVYRLMQSGLDFLAREFKKAGITIQDLESGA